MQIQLRNIAKILFSIGLIATLGGCSTAGYMDRPGDPGNSIVYGYIDMSDAPTSLQRISMKQLQPVSDKPYFGFFVDDGMFYRPNVPKGTYKFWEFGGFSTLRNADYTFTFPSQGKGAMDRKISKTGVYFAGCYKYKKVKTGFFSQGKFDMEPIGGNCELEMLARLEKWAKDPQWQRLISQHRANQQTMAGMQQ